MITEKYVSFETAKLLKDKGFDEECRAFWKEWDGQNMLCHCSSSHVFEWCHNSMLEGYNDDSELNVAAPTLQMAKDWLRVEKKLYIQVDLDGWALGGRRGYYIVIQGTDNDFEDMAPTVNEDDIVFFPTPEEATEAAIRYCLENLI